MEIIDISAKVFLINQYKEKIDAKFGAIVSEESDPDVIDLFFNYIKDTSFVKEMLEKAIVVIDPKIKIN